MQDDQQPIVTDRRRLLRNAGLGTAFAAALGLGLMRAANAQNASAPSDADILNFALNLEYLEAEFYLNAINGTGLPSKDIGGVGKTGEVYGGGAVPSKRLPSSNTRPASPTTNSPTWNPCAPLSAVRRSPVRRWI
jgi:hypothetical protein